MTMEPKVKSTSLEEQTYAMSPQEETFFREARLPVRLAAAAYSDSKDFQHLPFLVHGHEVEDALSKLLDKINPEQDRKPDHGFENWMTDIRVHVAVIPVKLPAQDPRDGRRKEESTFAWDLAFVYRGTQPYNVINWITDFTFKQEPVDDYILKHSDGQQQQHKILAHQGFLSAFKSIHPNLEPATEDNAVRECVSELKNRIILQANRKAATRPGAGARSLNRSLPESPSCQMMEAALQHNPPRRILSIGHSLGGALATLGAAWCKTTLCQRIFPDYQGCEVHCITIGSPRVGNKEFAETWDALLLNKRDPGKSLSYRIVNALDPVPSTPPSNLFRYQYQHVGVHPVYLERHVANWTVHVTAHLDAERPWINTGSPIDHLQWHYTSAMDAAEARASQKKSKETKDVKDVNKVREEEQEHIWLFALARQLHISDLWNLFVNVSTLELSAPAHFWLLLVSWAVALALFSSVSLCWLGLFFITSFLLPALSLMFLLECGIKLLLLPSHWVISFLQDWGIISLPESKLQHYKLGNFGLAVLSTLVMVITYVAAWLGF